MNINSNDFVARVGKRVKLVSRIVLDALEDLKMTYPSDSKAACGIAFDPQAAHQVTS